MKICGIYKITNLINNKCYIGQSVDCKHRLTIHKCDLIGNKHPNKHLQKSYNKYGKNNFRFDVMFLCSPQDLETTEIYFIDRLNGFYKNGGYNMTVGGDGCGNGINSVNIIFEGVTPRKTK